MSSKLLNYPAASSNPHLSAGSSGSTAGGPRNGTTSHGSAQLNFENLQLDDILCTVCQSVLVEPVFLPCQHRFCRNCLSGTIEKNNLNCPCCRKRFGTWYRNASRVNKLVHEQLWNAIQSQFRDYLDEDGAGRCNGNGSTGGCFLPQSESVIHLSEPGEIRKEYETELQRYRKELIEEKKKELAASEKYIINLYKQEGIIDLVDSSDHLSISSTTSTPEPEKKRQPTHEEQQQSTTAKSADAIHEVDDDEEAGPSGSSFPQQSGNNQKGNHPPQQPNQNSVISSSSNVHPSRPETTKSQSNGSVISISSTSSASAASSSCISSASSRYSLIKSAAKPQNKAQSSNQTGKAATLGNSSSGGSAVVVKKVFTMAELNKSELCVKPTKLHRRTSSQAVDDDDDDDGDSLRSELNHFKPIIATTPKSCFSSKAIVRVPSVRPETGLLPPKTECFSPSKSPFKPIDPTTPRRSAFSVVNLHLFTPPATIGQTAAGKSQHRKSTETSTSKKKQNKKTAATASGSSSVSATSVPGTKKQNGTTKKTNGTTSGGTNRRKRKLAFSPKPKGKVKDDNPPKEVSSNNKSNSRITRRTLNRESCRLKDLIVSDQQRREAMIEQERRDFEFAQKLQKKLNRTRGATMLLIDPLPKEAPTVVARKQNSAYSLRRKSVAVFPTAAAAAAAAAVMAPPPPPPRSTTSSIGSTASSRKKRTTPKVETKSANPPPTAKKPRLQAVSTTTTTTTTKQDEQPEAAGSRILRRSTRIRS